MNLPYWPQPDMTSEPVGLHGAIQYGSYEDEQQARDALRYFINPDYVYVVRLVPLPGGFTWTIIEMDKVTE